MKKILVGVWILLLCGAQPSALADSLGTLAKFKTAIEAGDEEMASGYLKQLPQGSPERKAAQSLYKDKKEGIDREAIRRRKDFAVKYEEILLSRGLDAYVKTKGKTHDTLEVKWVLVNRPLAHNITRDQLLMKTLAALGFKTLALEDGYDKGWTVSVQ